MSKAEVNNQIVLMRKNVVQAQVQVIKKLTRCMKKLRDKKGTEEQKTKNLRKAERIAAEILAIKKVKKDEIIHFALINFLDLETVLSDQTSDALKRIKTRIMHHKIFSKKIEEFKEKFPNYLKLLEPGRKKKAMLEKKAKRKENKLKNNKKIETTDNFEVEEIDVKLSSDETNDNDENKSEMIEVTTTEDLKEKEINDEKSNVDLQENIVKEFKIKKKTEKLKKHRVEEKLSSDELENNTQTFLQSKSLDGLKKKNDNNRNTETIKITPISKEAIVKKFTDVLKEENKNDEYKESKVNSECTKDEKEKQIDPFFVMNDGHTDFLSVAPRKRQINTDESTKRDFIQFNPEKYPPNRFSKNKFDDDNKRWNNKPNCRSTFNDNKSGSKWNSQQNKTSKFNENNLINESSSDYQSKKIKLDSNNLNDENNEIKMSRKERRSQMSNQNIIHLHPSWEAKKKQQDVLKQGFQGKKIVFDD